VGNEISMIISIHSKVYSIESCQELIKHEKFRKETMYKLYDIKFEYSILNFSVCPCLFLDEHLC